MTTIYYSVHTARCRQCW